MIAANKRDYLLDPRFIDIESYEGQRTTPWGAGGLLQLKLTCCWEDHQKQLRQGVVTDRNSTKVLQRRYLKLSQMLYCRFDATYRGHALRSFPGDFRSVVHPDGAVTRTIIHGSQSVKTLRGDALLLAKAPLAGLPQGGYDDNECLVQALVECFQDSRAARFLRDTPSAYDDGDGPYMGRTWSTWIFARGLDNAAGDAPAQRVRDILIKEVRKRHAGGTIRFVQDAVRIVREMQDWSGDEGL